MSQDKTPPVVIEQSDRGAAAIAKEEDGPGEGVHEGRASIWHLAEVMSWLQARGTYKVEASMLEVALSAMQVNLAKEVEVRQLQPKVRRDLRTLFA